MQCAWHSVRKEGLSTVGTRKYRLTNPFFPSRVQQSLHEPSRGVGKPHQKWSEACPMDREGPQGKGFFHYLAPGHRKSSLPGWYLSRQNSNRDMQKGANIPVPSQKYQCQF